ncbi:hypothetical protein [Streptomyces sp. NPDC014622]|uniref:hypothetical protein n=1 Tax=Streptomyces sp. NPDC014622 TaxID=3364874 RepID=UPI0036FFC2C6
MFDQAMARIAGTFRRVESRAAARAYLLGLLSSIEGAGAYPVLGALSGGGGQQADDVAGVRGGVGLAGEEEQGPAER